MSFLQVCHSCKSVIPASLSFLQVCHSCKSVIPASPSFLQVCHSCKSVIPASPSFLQVRHSCKSVIPASPSFLQVRHSCESRNLIETEKAKQDQYIKANCLKSFKFLKEFFSKNRTAFFFFDEFPYLLIFSFITRSFAFIIKDI